MVYLGSGRGPGITRGPGKHSQLTCSMEGPQRSAAHEATAPARATHTLSHHHTHTHCTQHKPEHQQGGEGRATLRQVSQHRRNTPDQAAPRTDPHTPTIIWLIHLLALPLVFYARDGQTQLNFPGEGTRAAKGLCAPEGRLGSAPDGGKHRVNTLRDTAAGGSGGRSYPDENVGSSVSLLIV